MAAGDTMQGRRLRDTRFGDLPEIELRPGDYWKCLSRKTGEPMSAADAAGDASTNLTGTVWQVVPPDVGYGAATLIKHTVREEEDGTISVRPDDGSSNSILVVGNQGKQWHGYIEHGIWREV